MFGISSIQGFAAAGICGAMQRCPRQDFARLVLIARSAPGEALAGDTVSIGNSEGQRIRSPADSSPAVASKAKIADPVFLSIPKTDDIHVSRPRNFSHGSTRYPTTIRPLATRRCFAARRFGSDWKNN